MGLHRRTRSLRAVWAPSFIRRVARRRLVWWGLAALFALFGGSQLHERLEAVEAERSSWGETERVVVAIESIKAGDRVSSLYEMRELPRAMIPPSAARSVPDGALAKVALHRDEIVLASRLTGADERGLPPGSSAMTLPLYGPAPLVQTGDLVDIWAVDSANLSSRRVGERLVVLARSDTDITVAVPQDQVADAAVVALRPVTAVLVG